MSQFNINAQYYSGNWSPEYETERVINNMYTDGYNNMTTSHVDINAAYEEELKERAADVMVFKMDQARQPNPPPPIHTQGPQNQREEIRSIYQQRKGNNVSVWEK